MSGLPASLRPHAKIHKSPQLAQMQIDAGGIGLPPPPSGRRARYVDHGFSDVLVANEVIGPVKAAETARAAGLGRVIVAVDSAGNVAELSDAAHAAGTQINLLVDVDVGQHRSGVASTAAAVELGRADRALAGREPGGLLGYEGHCMLEPDRELRITKARAANDILVAPPMRSCGTGSTPGSSPAAGSARGTSPGPTRASPRSTPAPTSSAMRFTARSCPGSIRRSPCSRRSSRAAGETRCSMRAAKADRHRSHGARGGGRRGRDPDRVRRALHPRGAHGHRAEARVRSWTSETASS